MVSRHCGYYVMGASSVQVPRHVCVQLRLRYPSLRNFIWDVYVVLVMLRPSLPSECKDCRCVDMLMLAEPHPTPRGSGLAAHSG